MSVWKSPEVQERLSWYYQVLRELRPAKFRICKAVSCDLNPAFMHEGELWKEHERLRKRFLEKKEHVSTPGSDQTSSRSGFSFLDVKVELLHRMLRKCTFCEWRCKVDRVEGTKRGACHLDSSVRVASFFRHFGEEPPLVDQHGSGTVFFSSCTFRCAFCQNWDISQFPAAGVPVSPQQLSLIIHCLRSEGAANINFVGGEPTPNLHIILEALTRTDVNVPILWNSNMYLTEEAMRVLADVVDIWLPDFKWGNDACALKYSRVVRYFEAVSRNHAFAYANGDMIVRHLVIPGHVECCTKPILSWVAANCPKVLVNIMAQYRPDYMVLREPEKYRQISRRPSIEELHEARDYADGLGLVWEAVS